MTACSCKRWVLYGRLLGGDKTTHHGEGLGEAADLNVHLTLEPKVIHYASTALCTTRHFGRRLFCKRHHFELNNQAGFHENRNEISTRPMTPSPCASSTIVSASYFFASSTISGSRARSPSIENTPSVMICR